MIQIEAGETLIQRAMDYFSISRNDGSEVAYFAAEGGNGISIVVRRGADRTIYFYQEYKVLGKVQINSCTLNYWDGFPKVLLEMLKS